jgi:hypothetical protein
MSSSMATDMVEKIHPISKANMSYWKCLPDCGYETNQLVRWIKHKEDKCPLNGMALS